MVGIMLFGMVNPTNGSAQSQQASGGPYRVDVVVKEAERRVDVLVDGELFTAYIYPTTLKKPTLYPLISAGGNPVTRGFPLDPRPNERTDHPHQVGLWFNYGDVNGLDFWNNSDAIPPQNAPRMGTILHREVRSAQGGIGSGTLEVVMDWVNHEGETLLREETKFVFHAGPGVRAVDRITKLTAVNGPVSMNDNKEGVLGMRVARSLEQPSERPQIFTDSSGVATVVDASSDDDVTGWYRSSEGLEGDDVWGTRGRWTMLSGIVNDERVTIAILDHPENVGHPTYWHARGYGLFAANPLGRRELSGGKDVLNFALGAGESTTFRYRILIHSAISSPEWVDAQFDAFASGQPVVTATD